jgi:hypothetical protein
LTLLLELVLLHVLAQASRDALSRLLALLLKLLEGLHDGLGVALLHCGDEGLLAALLELILAQGPLHLLADVTCTLVALLVHLGKLLGDATSSKVTRCLVEVVPAPLFRALPHQVGSEVLLELGAVLVALLLEA